MPLASTFLERSLLLPKIYQIRVLLVVSISSHCLWAVVILKSLLGLSAGPLQDSRGCSIYEHTPLRVFLLTDNLHLLDCSVTCSLLTRTDTDWTCWLAAHTPVQKHEHKFETNSDSSHTVHRQYTAYKQYTAGSPCVKNGRTAASSAAVSWRHYVQEMLSMRFQETAQSEQHWHSNEEIKGLICRKLRSINECTSHWNMPKDGR